MMLSRLWNPVVAGFFAVSFFLQPVICFAQEKAAEAEKQPEWVLSYFLMLLCLSLAVLILLRPARRSDTAFTQEEIAAQKAEEMKKMTGSHT